MGSFDTYVNRGAPLRRDVRVTAPHPRGAANWEVKRNGFILGEGMRSRGWKVTPCFETDPAVLEANYRMKLKNQDYKDQDPVEALKDFKVGRYIDCLKGRDGWLTE